MGRWFLAVAVGCGPHARRGRRFQPTFRVFVRRATVIRLLTFVGELAVRPSPTARRHHAAALSQSPVGASTARLPGGGGYIRRSRLATCCFTRRSNGCRQVSSTDCFVRVARLLAGDAARHLVSDEVHALLPAWPAAGKLLRRRLGPVLRWLARAVCGGRWRTRWSSAVHSLADAGRSDFRPHSRKISRTMILLD